MKLRLGEVLNDELLAGKVQPSRTHERLHSYQLHLSHLLPFLGGTMTWQACNLWWPCCAPLDRVDALFHPTTVWAII